MPTSQVPASVPLIRFISPNLPPADAWVHHLAESYRSGVFSNGGPTLQAFADAMTAAFAPAGTRAVPVSSGTAGLVGALHALGIRGEVVCPAFSFAASVHAISLAGCQPLLCDVDPMTWELSPASLALAMARRPAAILHVRAFGLCRDLAPIEEIAAEAGIPLIIDAAAALGGRLAKGQAVGGQGTCEVFSLHATKPFGIGEGGLVVAPQPLAERIERTVNFALSHGRILSAGSNGKMSEFQAAVGQAVLASFAGQLAIRRKNISHYESLVHNSAAWMTPHDSGHFPGQTMPLRALTTTGQAAVSEAARHGIEARSYYAPSLDEVEAFSSYTALGPCEVSRSLSRTLVCLPAHVNLTPGDFSVIEAYLANMDRLTCRRQPTRQVNHQHLRQSPGPSLSLL